MRNPDYRGRRYSCRRALLVSSLTAVRGPWLMLLARFRPSRSFGNLYVRRCLLDARNATGRTGNGENFAQGCRCGSTPAVYGRSRTKSAQNSTGQTSRFPFQKGARSASAVPSGLGPKPFFFQRFRHQVPRFLSGGQSMSSHDVRLIWLEISTGFLLPFPSCDFIFQTSSPKYPHTSGKAWPEWSGIICVKEM